MLKASLNEYDLSDTRNEWYESMVRISGDSRKELTAAEHGSLLQGATL